MQCPQCGSDTTVYAGKAQGDNYCRYRKCVEWGHTFITLEYTADHLDYLEHKLKRDIFNKYVDDLKAYVDGS